MALLPWFERGRPFVEFRQQRCFDPLEIFFGGEFRIEALKLRLQLSKFFV